jgi:hypothetical protein
LYDSGDVFRFTDAVHAPLSLVAELNHTDAGALSVDDEPADTDAHAPDAFVQKPASDATLLARPPQPSVMVDTAPLDASVKDSADGITEPDTLVKPIRRTL